MKYVGVRQCTIGASLAKATRHLSLILTEGVILLVNGVHAELPTSAYTLAEWIS
jgi:hypothetical protein